ncbi:hypothetical protein ACMGDK_11460 [Chryseobacterium sp. DT-3]|uniref:hypothetical protein n=1 Tax=Chryseobacterium sp. DT-3 TaxID=3396164 RepID=UPI003F1E20B5
MKLEELRIGSMLYDSVRDKNVTLELKHFKELAIDEKCFFDRYKPIELTEEWIKLFGYKDEVFDSGKILVSEEGGYIIPHLSNTMILKYVHQLMTLIYSTSGFLIELNYEN